MKKSILFSAIGLTLLTSNPTTMAQNAKEPMVEITTEMGVIKIKLYNETSKHRDNFIKLVEQKFFDGTLFHRVIQNFMIQGGDPDSKNARPGQQLGMGGPGYTIPAEFNPKFIHKKGALSAARMGDDVNPKKESSGSQFYIVQGNRYAASDMDGMTARTGFAYTPEQKNSYATVGGTPHLDGNYTVFGEVVEGLEVIDKIAASKTAPGDRPLQDVKMTMKAIKK